MHKRLTAALAAAGCCASAGATSTWETRMQFRQVIGGAEGAVILGNSMPLTATGVYTFAVQVGIFNFNSSSTSESNHGLFDWTGDIQASLGAGESLGLNQAVSRQSPFDYGPSTAFGGTLQSNTHIANINAAREIGPTPNVTWPSGLPQPTGPQEYGQASYVSVFRFTASLNSLGGSNRVFTFTGSAGPVVAWSPFQVVSPSGGNPGSVNFLGLTRTAGEGGALEGYSPTTLTLVVPGPGTAGMLVPVMMWIGPRRRRGG